MSKKDKRIGKIGYCDNKNIPVMKDIKGGHYVYIRDIKDGKCTINIVTSLEDKNHKFSDKKLYQVRKGNTYAIPINDSDFTRWSGVTNNAIGNINISDIQNIGYRKIKRRHRFFIDKFIK